MRWIGSGTSASRGKRVGNERIKKLLDFTVGGRVVTVHPGPVVTMYEFEPASGVKVNRIVSLADDLALQDDLSPAQLVPTDDEDTLAVVMPMRI